jgi:hypothetical protein
MNDLYCRTSPLENNSNTVLIVGGVQWLGKQHINTILSALKRYIYCINTYTVKAV